MITEKEEKEYIFSLSNKRSTLFFNWNDETKFCLSILIMTFLFMLNPRFSTNLQILKIVAWRIEPAAKTTFTQENIGLLLNITILW